MEVAEPRPGSGKSIDVRRFHHRVPGAAEPVPAMLIRHDEQEIRSVVIGHRGTCKFVQTKIQCHPDE
jgi:hypothetical protein